MFVLYTVLFLCDAIFQVSSWTRQNYYIHCHRELMEKLNNGKLDELLNGDNFYTRVP